MTTVKAVSTFKRRNEIIPPGTILQIPDEMLAKLSGFVEVVKTPPLTPDAAGVKIGAVIAELDKRRPWPDDLMRIITAKARERIQRANQAVDHAVDQIKDPDALDLALAEYRAAWLAALDEVQPKAPACYWCGSSDFWQGRGRKICRVCHPPAPGAEVSF